MESHMEISFFISLYLKKTMDILMTVTIRFNYINLHSFTKFLYPFILTNTQIQGRRMRTTSESHVETYFISKYFTYVSPPNKDSLRREVKCNTQHNSHHAVQPVALISKVPNLQRTRYTPSLTEYQLVIKKTQTHRRSTMETPELWFGRWTGKK